MSAQAPGEYTLEDVAEFHRQLLLLDDAGLKLNLDEGTSVERNLRSRLDRILSSLAGQATKSASIEDVVQQDGSLSRRYREALETWIRGQKSPDALATLHQPVQLEQEGTADLKLALLLPLIIVCVIYGASYYLLTVTVPRMEAIYDQLREPPSLFIQWLVGIRETMSIWGPSVPVVLIVLGWLIGTGRLSLPRWLPGRARAFHYLSASLAARNLASKLERNAASSTGSLDDAENERALQMPMLRWALTDSSLVESSGESSIDASQSSRRLRIAARLYETMHSLHFQRFRTGLMLFTCIVLGGGMTLVYALALFAPLVQLLKDIVL